MNTPTISHDGYPPATTFKASEEDKDLAQADVRSLARTPSPTPSEAEELKPRSKLRKYCLLVSLFDLDKLKKPKELLRIAIIAALMALLILFVIYQQAIVNWLRPFADWMRRTPGGWVIPIVLLIVLSFPPLFGHEIVAILVGDAWGIGIGFAIVAAGTILGEMATYWVFRSFCMARGEKMEGKKLKYALLAEVIRQGGFKTAVVVRYSAIPGHLATAIFATCGMGVFTFLIAAVLSLPKQLATVYLGDAQGGAVISSKMHTVKTVVVLITILLTTFAMRFLRYQTDKVKETVIYHRRKIRQAKLRDAAGVDPEADLGSDSSGSRTEDALWRYEGVIHSPAPQKAPTAHYAHARSKVSGSRMDV
ncbi:hypothetical protein BN946_scf184641.g6 [Trametes cinnabarina]|uniref:Golgi apparatus membrane protein TVP38 n=1 Tax=Pycnoporus cinnabarinus TaxID=5643 RepID=A0A060SJE7_PYCCI|nr:hypothetical protein BN946_scf184641.g6 [Trametes cinnabarina]